MSLADRLLAQIRESGPLTIPQYMIACLHDPQDGYYATRPALGEAGDFVTAPLVSQMFGELIGAWLVEVWTLIGQPAPFRLVEMGPGDGTLASDVARTARLAPDFAAAADLWLVEVSEPLRARQAERLQGAPIRTRWAGRLEDVPGGAPLLLVANELLDCLPARQFLRTDRGWGERMVGEGDDGRLAFGLAPAEGLPDAPEGTILELSPSQEALGAELGARVRRDGGAALLIDYGRSEPGFGDTLQALKGHRKLHPLACPGSADLTVHADFPAVLAAARAEGASTAIAAQGDFLLALGIEARAAALARANPARAEQIGRQLQRLVAPGEMGQLFKAAAIAQPGAALPGFGT